MIDRLAAVSAGQSVSFLDHELPDLSTVYAVMRKLGSFSRRTDGERTIIFRLA